MFKQVSPQEAFAALSAKRGARLVDVRTEEEFSTIRAEGAVHIVLNEISAAALEKAGIHARDTELYLICKVGGRSAQACQKLAWEGFTNLHNIMGGTIDWVELDLPYEIGETR
ncbi:MAG: hypothetical protein RIQ81_2717 [Pseudomonadota bacterium]|jgi:rhodanese-related sulfurtransferase